MVSPATLLSLLALLYWLYLPYLPYPTLEYLLCAYIIGSP